MGAMERLDYRVMSWQGAVEATVEGLGYELVDAEKSAGGLLRVFIDHPAPIEAQGRASAPRFITVEDCEAVTRQLQHVLEVEGCAYERLEVSSPGLDRPLKKAADYQRFTGEQVELTLKLPFKGRKKYRGELQALDGGWRLVLPEGGGAEAEQRALDFSLDEVREARLVPVIDFKGRRFAPQGEAGREPGAVLRAGNEVDGGRIQ
jgi:ribosome maturation factor RimP